jgi:PAS domain S-box-containing protein
MKFQVTGSFYKSLFDNANDGILLADLETKKFYIANKAICEMLGYSLKEFKKLGVADIHPKKDLQYVIGQFEKQARGKIGESILAEDMPTKRKDGSVFYTDISASRIRMSGKMYLMGIFRDMTKRNEIEKNLKDARIAASNVLEDLGIEKIKAEIAKAKEEALLKSIGEGLVAVGKDGNIILINHAFEELLGWEESEAQGKFLVQIVPMVNEKGEIIPESERPINKIVKENSGIIKNSAMFLKRKDGKIFPVSTTASPIIANNEIIGAIEVFRWLRTSFVLQPLQ